MMLRFAALAVALLFAAPPATAAEPIVLDTGDASAWTAIASPGATARLEAGDGRFALDFDLGRGRSHAIARRAVDVDLPPDYMFVFEVASDAEPNTIEIKLVSGENVWWRRLADLDLAKEWGAKKTLRVSRPRIEFAWGPAAGGMPAHLDSIEIAVVAGKGGRGKIWIDEIRLEPRDPQAAGKPPSVSVSSNAPDAARLLDGDVATVWRSAEGDAVVTLDFHEPVEQGGLVIEHAEPGFSETYVVEASLDGGTWEAVRRFTHGNGGTDHVYLPEVWSRYLRIRFEMPPRRRASIAEIRVQPFEYSATINGFFSTVARHAPPGEFPRYFSGEQSYWTVVGVPGDREEALVNEEGSVEVAAGGFTIEPFVWNGSRLRTWKDATSTVSLADGELPMPSVTRRDGDLALSVTAFASGAAGASTLHLRYRLEAATAPARVRLFLALRPFQVLPAWQTLNRVGGATPIRRIERVGRMIRVDDRQVVALTGSFLFGAASFEEGDIVEFLRRGDLPPKAAVTDEFGFASAAFAWDVDVKPGMPGEVWLAVPWSPQSAVEGKGLPQLLETTRDQWRARVARVPIELPGAAADWVASLRSNLAYVLVNLDGDAIQPGSRTYERSWIRDGAMTSSALLELGLEDEVKAFVRWFAGFVGGDGYVPCCVDGRGADPVPENDSFGEFIWAVAETWRFTRDEAFVREMWPKVRAVADHMSRLRRTRMTAEYEAPERRAMFGLLPESISHEGYSARPVHSYWDQAFALRGFADAAMLAGVAGDADAAARIAAERDAFEKDLAESIRRTTEAHRLSVVPASVELGDFDPTSTALSFLLGTERVYSADALLRSFDQYMGDLRRRRGLRTPGVGYTAYELRSATALVLLGRKPEAIELLSTLVDDQRPPSWNQWPEISWLRTTEPQFLGDIPHTWIGTSFIHAVRRLLVVEREGPTIGREGPGSGASLLVGAGIPLAWLDDGGVVRARALPTWFGPVSVEMSADPAATAARRVTVKVEDGAGDGAARRFEHPDGGVHIAAPFGVDVVSASIDGEQATLERGSVRVPRLPATVVFQYKPPRE